jgi:uncharacterized protein (TIGR04255 family)
LAGNWFADVPWLQLGWYSKVEKNPTMSIEFNKAPLIELIAELRWIPMGAIALPGQQPASAAQMFFTNDAKIEELFMRLGGELYQSGFQRSERLVPAGFPIIFGQPVIRYRSDDAVKKSVLYQAGSSVFSVHAILPYRTWKNFAPQLEKGVEALLKVRSEAIEQSPFTQATLRYLDFFGGELLAGRTPESFISEVLGFHTTLPGALEVVAEPKEVRSVFFKFVVPLKIGSLSVSVGDGNSNNRPGVVLDTIVTVSAPIEAKLDAIMKMFNYAHEIIRKNFLEFTKPIQELMEPKKAEG